MRVLDDVEIGLKDRSMSRARSTLENMERRGKGERYLAIIDIHTV